MSEVKKIYLGDSVYASSDGFHIILETNNGLGSDNVIFLDDNALGALFAYVGHVYKKKISITPIETTEAEP